MRIFITGKPGSGKTTLILKIAEEIKKKGKSIGGFITQDIRVKNKRKGFKIKNLDTGEEGILAHVDQKEGPRVSKYRVNIHDLEEIGVKAIELALDKDWIIVDEIGKMELYGKSFEWVIREIIDLNKNILATIHWRYRHELILEIKKNYKVYSLSRENQERVFEDVLKDLQ